GTLTLGTAEGIFTTYTNSATAPTSAANLAISSTVTGTAGLTVSSPTTAPSVAGALALNSPHSVPSTNAVQTLTFGAGNTGGTFQLTFNGQTTGAITYSNTFSVLQQNIQSALGVLSTIGSPANVLIGGTVTSTTVTFLGALAGAPQPV